MKTSALKQYFSDSLDEIKKVVWPTKEQLIQICLAVLGIGIFFTVMIGMLDFVFNTFYQFLLAF